MISIVICDDELAMGKRIESTVQSLLLKKGIPCTMQCFSDSKLLLYEIEDGTCYDLLLLDIEMPELDGISLTNRIKKYLPNCLIIFITSYDKYVYDSFKVQPFRFIPKRSMEQRLPEAISEAVSWIEKNVHRFYEIENQQGMERIPIGEIAYIWHREKYAYIEKMNGECAKVRKTLKQVFSELPTGNFIWIDRGCICNLSQIMKVSGGDVYLTNGVNLAVSRERLTEVKEKISGFWLDGEGE